MLLLIPRLNTAAIIQTGSFAGFYRPLLQKKAAAFLGWPPKTGHGRVEARYAGKGHLLAKRVYPGNPVEKLFLPPGFCCRDLLGGQSRTYAPCSRSYIKTFLAFAMEYETNEIHCNAVRYI